MVFNVLLTKLESKQKRKFNVDLQLRIISEEKSEKNKAAREVIFKVHKR